jgi:ribosomal protein S12 methylthiotransferase accessory factor
MRTEITVGFPGNKKVYAEYKGFTIQTDQTREAGGEGSAPSPFDLFLASLATCGGIYVVDFCRNRGIPLDGIKFTQSMTRDPETKMVNEVAIRIELPKGFPDKYKDGLLRAVDLCTVKRHILNPPKFTLEAVKAG